MKAHLIVLSAIIALVYGGTVSPCFRYNGGFFYTSEVSQSCNQLCESRGGFDFNATRHTGNAVGQHFWPEKTPRDDWIPIECSSVDNNSNWGATGEDVEPEADWSSSLCHLNCACMTPTDDCVGELCANVEEGGYCNFYSNGNSTAGHCTSNGECVIDGTPCENENNTCTTANEYWNGVCVGIPVADGTPCKSTEQCSQCVAGTCSIIEDLTCNDGNESTCNDTCSVTGVCAGTTCPMPIAEPVDEPVSVPAKSPIDTSSGLGSNASHLKFALALVPVIMLLL